MAEACKYMMDMARSLDLEDEGDWALHKMLFQRDAWGTLPHAGTLLVNDFDDEEADVAGKDWDD